LEVDSELFSDRQLEFFIEGMTLSLQIVDGDVLWANMPEYMTLKVVKTTAKGVADSALSVKDATLENGAVIKVPLYVEVGNEVRITTEDGAFVEKV
jgi:elongation factor P